MKNAPLKRVRNQELSLWQSVVAELALSQARSMANDADSVHVANIQDHPMIQATNNFIDQAEAHAASSIEAASQLTLAAHPADDALAEDINTYLSGLCFKIGQAKAKGQEQLEEDLTKTYRKYSDKDPGFLTCATTFAQYYAIYGGVLKYNDWRVEGKGDINYGVIDYKIPNNAKVAIIGDWGTGMPDAEYLLETLMKQHQPDVIIHLGDIYYSATPTECQDNFALILERVFMRVFGAWKRIPVFTIPGNHDYYAMGYGYYEMVEKLNQFKPKAVQHASYFCLRTEDDGWQFVAMDTGFDDANPADQFNTYYAGPNLHESEVVWLQDKLDNFAGASILLSHHQLYSSNAKINGSLSVYGSYPNMNKYLLDPFQRYFGNKVASWLWGHEHNAVIFQDGLYGLDKGRLIGASAFEELTSQDPYKVNYPNVPIQPYRLGYKYGYYNHSYAIIDFATRKSPSDSVEISYWEYPSWGDFTPKPIPSKAKHLLTESLRLTPHVPGKKISYNMKVQINSEEGLDYIAKINSGIQYYPTLGQKPVELEILGGVGVLMDGDLVQIKTLEPEAGKYNLLGVWTTPAAYYYAPGYDNQWWYIKKRDQSNSREIREHDAIFFINKKYAGQYLCPLIQTAYSGTHLTSDAKVPAAWFLKAV